MLDPTAKGVPPLRRSQTKWLHALYLSHAETLYRVARFRLGDPDRAMDLVHSVFLAAAEKVSQLQRHENPRAWLLRALNFELSHEFARLEKERKTLSLEDLPKGTAGPPPALGLAEVLPAQLSARDREVLCLYYEEGLSYQEIADRLDIPVSTCGTRLSRAKGRCRALLAEAPDARNKR